MPDNILLVDDDKDFRSVFKLLLNGYKVFEAANGKDALVFLKKPNEIDLVILDVMMPGLSGTEVLREIKNINPGLAVVILTAYGTKDTMVEALRSHADDFIEKGIPFEEAKEIIDRVLEKRKSEDEIDLSSMAAKIEKVKRFIERNAFKKISLDDAAKNVCLSPKYLSRTFKKFAGIGFSDYKLKLKIEKAKELLSSSANNVNQVSDKLGYENAESFIRQFKKITKFTPTEFRNSKKDKK